MAHRENIQIKRTNRPVQNPHNYDLAGIYPAGRGRSYVSLDQSSGPTVRPSDAATHHTSPCAWAHRGNDRFTSHRPEKHAQPSPFKLTLNSIPNVQTPERS